MGVLGLEDGVSDIWWTEQEGKSWSGEEVLCGEKEGEVREKRLEGVVSFEKEEESEEEEEKGDCRVSSLQNESFSTIDRIVRSFFDFSTFPSK